ncbi:hypothetical protein G3M53_90095, partial [Streptomyces sp. SID7982]|nr:hypothetical protein [Streptomyces sp. SID7982]
MRPVFVRPLVRFGTGAVATAGILLAGLSAPASAAGSDQLWIAAPYEKNLQLGAEAGTPVEVGLYHDNDTFTVT